MKLSEHFIMKLARIVVNTLAETKTPLLHWSQWFWSDARFYSFKVQYLPQSSGSGFCMYSQQSTIIYKQPRSWLRLLWWIGSSSKPLSKLEFDRVVTIKGTHEAKLQKVFEHKSTESYENRPWTACFLTYILLNFSMEPSLTLMSLCCSKGREVERPWERGCFLPLYYFPNELTDKDSRNKRKR